jgi:hypothetical protein
MTPTIEVVITPQGDTTVTTRGFVGADCREASQAIERSLGVSTKEQLTAEYYTSHATETQQQQQRLEGQ